MIKNATFFQENEVIPTSSACTEITKYNWGMSYSSNEAPESLLQYALLFRTKKIKTETYEHFFVKKHVEGPIFIFYFTFLQLLLLENLEKILENHFCIKFSPGNSF